MALATVQQCENNVASDISQMQGWCERAQDHNNRQALDLNLLSLVAADSAIVNSKVESLLFGIITLGSLSASGGFGPSLLVRQGGQGEAILPGAHGTVPGLPSGSIWPDRFCFGAAPLPD